jgi:hypothetical protein
MILFGLGLALVALPSYGERAQHDPAIAGPAIASPTASGMVLIPAGSYAPLIRTKDEPERVPVASY